MSSLWFKVRELSDRVTSSCACGPKLPPPLFPFSLSQSFHATVTPLCSQSCAFVQYLQSAQQKNTQIIHSKNSIPKGHCMSMLFIIKCFFSGSPTIQCQIYVEFLKNWSSNFYFCINLEVHYSPICSSLGAVARFCVRRHDRHQWRWKVRHKCFHKIATKKNNVLQDVYFQKSIPSCNVL